MRLDEQRIVGKLIREALDEDLTISVFDGEEWALKTSTDYEAITKEVAATDITELRFRDKNRKSVGWAMLVHGNGEDVISDYTDNETMNRLVK